MSDEEANGDTAILLDRSSARSDHLSPSHSHASSSSTSGCISLRGLYNKSCVVFLASVIAAIGGLLFGYDVGIISGALLQLDNQWHLNCSQKQLVVSSMLFGALGASCVGGFIVDTIGRKWTIILNSVVFIVGAVILALSPNFSVLIGGRIVVGFAVSLSAISECIYISEIAPPKKRGLLVSLNELGITVGFLLAYLINFFLSDMGDGWRYMFGISVIPALVQMLGMFFLPPSPHYLMLKKREHQAEKVLSNLRGEPDVRQEITNIRIALDGEKDQGCCSLFGKQDNMRYRMLVALGLVLFQQITGQPNVLYYASYIFESVGFCSEKDATFASVILGIVKLVATVISMLLVDKSGRRLFLLAGAFLMMLSIGGLGLMAYANPGQFNLSPCQDVPLQFDPATPTTLSTFTTAMSQNVTWSHGSTSDFRSAQIEQCNRLSDNTTYAAKWLSMGFLTLYVAAYSIGFGPVTWLVLSEIFPTSVKGRAIATATMLNWGANILISSTFLDVMAFLSVGLTFLMYSFLCLLSIIFVFLVVPETKNKSLHQLSKEIQQSRPGKRIANNCSRISQSSCWCCCCCCKNQRYHKVVAHEVALNDEVAETST